MADSCGLTRSRIRLEAAMAASVPLLLAVDLERSPLTKLTDYPTDWKRYWDERSGAAGSDFEFDRGVAPRDQEIEGLSEAELLRFIDPKPMDVVFDAGCGTGVNMLLLHSKVKRIIGMDYSQGAVERCRRRIQGNEIENADASEGSITRIPLPDCSVDKVLCLSVLQYIDERDVTMAFAEFARILKDGGILVLHVKNLSSLYLSTLWLGQQIKLRLGKPCKLGHYRTYNWYVKALNSFGFDIVDYNSFNLFVLPKMPTGLEVCLQKFELRNYTRPFLRPAWIRRRGADLKMKARVNKAAAG
jgi:ubiquinone/menaquinone biosynthesis C-methylase UbiE